MYVRYWTCDCEASIIGWYRCFQNGRSNLLQKVHEMAVAVKEVYLKTDDACRLLSFRSGVSIPNLLKFSPDKPNIFMPWTTVSDKPKSGEKEHGNRESGAMAPLQKFNLFLHGTEGGVCSPHRQKRWSFGTLFRGWQPCLLTARFPYYRQVYRYLLFTARSVCCLFLFLWARGEREVGGTVDCKIFQSQMERRLLQGTSQLENPDYCSPHFVSAFDTTPRHVSIFDGVSGLVFERNQEIRHCNRDDLRLTTNETESDICWAAKSFCDFPPKITARPTSSK